MRKPVANIVAIAIGFATLTIGALHARADLAPPDSCTSPGQPCQNAGPQFNQPGTCVSATCTKQVPAADGGTMSMTYDCSRCQLGTGGAGGGGAGGSGTGGSGTGGSGAGGSGLGGPSKTGSSGCAVAPAGESGRTSGTAWLIATLMLVIARRRTSVG